MLSEIDLHQALSPLGPAGGGVNFFGFVRLCGHSHCSEIRRRSLAIAAGDARRVDARMTMHAMTVDTMSWSADRQCGIPGTFILKHISLSICVG